MGLAVVSGAGIAGVRLTIESYGTTIIDRQLLRFSERLLAPVQALSLAAVILREKTEEQFDTEGKHASGGWPELADSTQANRERMGYDPEHPILELTGRLKASLTRKFDPDHVERLSEDSLTFGSLVPYGIYHQSDKPRTKIPYRPPVALTEEDKREMIVGMQASILGSVEGGAIAAARAIPV